MKAAKRAQAQAHRARVLIIGPSMEVLGGIATCVRSQFASSLAVDYDLQLFPVSFTDGTWFRRSWVWRALTRAFVLVPRLLRRRPDLVHIHTASRSSFWGNSLAAVLCRFLARCPVVFHIHGAEFDLFIQENSGWRKRWIKRALRKAAGVVVLSPHWSHVLREIAPADRIWVIENTTIFPIREPRREFGHPLKVLFVGAVGPRKGVHALIQAAVRLEAEGDAVQFQVVGGSEFEGDFENTVEYLRQAGAHNVELLGPLPRDELLAYYGNADIFVLPSHAEGMPCALLEAMASALPIVTTRVGGIADVLDDDNALFVTPGDVEGIVGSIRRLARDSELRQTMSAQNVRLFVERYSLESYAKKLGTLYGRILGDDVADADRLEEGSP